MPDEREPLDITTICEGKVPEVFKIDQVISPFLFRARSAGNDVQFALFEADGGRWKLTAVQAIVDWFAASMTKKLPVIS